MAIESRTLVILALIANGVTAVIKVIAAASSGSSAMLSEATRIFIELEPGL